jgi:hypothetical protein
MFNIENPLEILNAKLMKTLDVSANLAASRGDLAGLMASDRTTWSADTFTLAAFSGSSTCIVYLQSDDCPVNDMAAAYAMFNSEKIAYSILTYFIRSNVPIGPLCAAYAAYKHPNIVRRIHQLGLPWDKMAPAMATSAGRLDVLKYLIEHGCPIDSVLCTVMSVGADPTRMTGIVNCLAYLDCKLE